MSYADTTIIQTRLGSLYKDNDGPGEITDAMITIAINDADTTIQSELKDNGITPPDDTDEDINDLKTAANLLTLSDLLDTAYEGVDGERAASARTFETRAYNLLDKYISRPTSEGTERRARLRSFVAGNHDPTTDLVDEDDFGDEEW